MKEEAIEIEEEFREMEQRTKSEADIMFNMRSFANFLKLAA